MGKRIGIACIFLGIVCLLSAVGFIVCNRWEDNRAASLSQDLLQDVQNIIVAPQPELLPDDKVLPPDNTQKPPTEMATVEVDGYDCIGILSIPVLELELPVLTPWSYTKLNRAPCHYYGTCYEKDFVISAHNYRSHFGRLSELQAGDIVIFTDVHGVAHSYEVVLLETLPPTATEAMITSGFDLSLYTCTPGGANRVTVRCSLRQ